MLYEFDGVEQGWLDAIHLSAPHSSSVLPHLGLALVDASGKAGGLPHPERGVRVASAGTGAGEWRAIAEGFESILAHVAGSSAPALGEGYPVLEFSGSPALHRDPGPSFAPLPPLLAAINLSLVTHPDHEAGPTCIVRRALERTAPKVLPIAAVGNQGGLPGRVLTSSWARLEAVLGVGATEDSEGTRLADYSSRGSPDAHASGPDLVSVGRSAVDPGVRGTSYAAPRIAACAAIATIALLQIRNSLQRAFDIHEAIPQVGVGLVDVDHPKDIRGERLPGWPIGGVDDELVRRLASAIGSASVCDRFHPRPGMIRRLLLECVRPMPDYEPHEVGCGFLDRDVLVDALGAMTLATLWAAASPEPPSLPRTLANARPFLREELRVMVELAAHFDPLWFWEVERRELIVYERGG